jgi:predicted MFS family arabinose efflux permease
MYPLMAVGMAITAGLPGFSIVLFGAFLRAFAGGIIWVFSTQLLLNAVPGQVRGRVFSTEFALFTLASAIGTAAGGWGLDQPALGLSGLMTWMAGLALVPGALWAWWLWRGQDQMVTGR